MTLDDLYEEFESNLRGYAISLTHDPDRADDLVQETFIRAMGHLTLLAQLKRHQQRAWLHRTLKNRFIDEQRRETRRQALLEQIVMETPVHDFTAGLIVTEMLASVPEQYRELLYQRYILGKNSSELAVEFEVPPATIRSRLHLARKWIQRHRADFLD